MIHLIKAAVLASVLLLAACGSDDEPSSGAKDEVDVSTVTEEADSDRSPSPETCPPVPTFDGSIERSADEELGHVAVSLAGADITDAIGSELFGFHEIYLSDQDMARERLDKALAGELSTDVTVDAAPGATVVMLGFGDISGGGAMSVGDVFDAADSQLLVTVDTGGGNVLLAENQEGTVEVLELSESAICVAVDYSDSQQAVSGVANVPRYDGSN